MTLNTIRVYQKSSQSGGVDFYDSIGDGNCLFHSVLMCTNVDYFFLNDVEKAAKALEMRRELGHKCENLYPLTSISQLGVDDDDELSLVSIKRELLDFRSKSPLLQVVELLSHMIRINILIFDEIKLKFSTMNVYDDYILIGHSGNIEGHFRPVMESEPTVELIPAVKIDSPEVIENSEEFEIVTPDMIKEINYEMMQDLYLDCNKQKYLSMSHKMSLFSMLNPCKLVACL